jgi:hypothetical protein
VKRESEDLMALPDILDRCPKCDRPRFNRPHACTTAWEVRDLEEDDGEWTLLYEPTAEDAATRWVAQDNAASGEYPSWRTVAVRRFGETVEAVTYEVELEMTPSYTARRARNQKPKIPEVET